MKKELFIAAAFSMTLLACDRPDHTPKSEYLSEVEVGEDVENNQEKKWIEKKAKSVNGVKNIDNQLEAKTGQGAYYYN